MDNNPLHFDRNSNENTDCYTAEYISLEHTF